jgi:hypothetical protein
MNDRSKDSRLVMIQILTATNRASYSLDAIKQISKTKMTRDLQMKNLRIILTNFTQKTKKSTKRFAENQVSLGSIRLTKLSFLGFSDQAQNSIPQS